MSETAARVPGTTEREFVPGTVHLVDLEGTMHVKHASGGQKDVVLVPAPSADPDDPLNWTPRRKLLSTVCMCVYTLMVGIASAAIYSVLTPISNQTGLSLDNLNSGTGCMFLFFGWGCLIWQPIALQYGKRPVYLFSILATAAISIWAAYTTTYGQWIGSKILQGFFGAPIESLCEISVTDIYFTHERGTYMAIYALFLAGSNFFAPIIAGFINDAQGWKWVLYWQAIFCVIGFVFLFFFMEETNYDRSRAFALSGTATPGSVSSEKTAINAPEPTSEEKKGPETTPAADTASAVEAGETQHVFTPKTFMDKLKLFDKHQLSKPNRIGRMMWRPLVFLTFPVIAYSGFSYGSYLVWFNVLNGTTSLILGGAPYDFRASMVGLSYFSPLIGVCLGSLFTGRFGDWFVIKMARRNKGIMEPEHRLWLFSVCFILVPWGLIQWGVGAAHSIHWFGLIFAMGILAVITTMGIQLSCSYCIDSYRELSGEAMITVILVRNTMSFAVGYGITPWVTNMGYQNAFIVAAFAGIAQVATFLAFVKWGKGMRRRSVTRYYKYVKQMQEDGMVH